MSLFAHRDIDLAARARFLMAAAWAGGSGFVLGAMVGVYAWDQWGWPFPVATVGLGLMVAVILTTIVMLLLEGVGLASRRAFAPSGSTTPYRNQYSRARSLEVRERFEDAVTAYRDHIAERPSDPEPYVRIARIHRDNLRQPDEALRWFRAARAAPEVKPVLEALLTREIVALLIAGKGDPARAAPELARAAERWAGTPDGEWASRELDAIKREMRKDEGP